MSGNASNLSDSAMCSAPRQNLSKYLLPGSRLTSLPLFLYICMFTLIPIVIMLSQAISTQMTVGSKTAVLAAARDSVTCGIAFTVMAVAFCYVFAVALETAMHPRARVASLLVGTALFVLADTPLSVLIADCFRKLEPMLSVVGVRTPPCLPTVSKLLLQTGTVFAIVPLLSISASRPLALAAMNMGCSESNLILKFLLRRAKSALLLLGILGLIWGIAAPNSSAEIRGFYPLHDLVSERTQYPSDFGENSARSVALLMLGMTITLVIGSLFIKFRGLANGSITETHSGWPDSKCFRLFSLIARVPHLLIFLIVFYALLRAFSRGGFGGESGFQGIALRTLMMSTLAVIIAFLLAVPAAYHQALRPVPSGLVTLFALTPILIPPVVYGISALDIVAWIRQATGLSVPKQWFLTLFFAARGLPFIYLICLMSFRSTDLRIVTAARNLGATHFLCFREIIWPQCWPFVVASVSLALSSHMTDSALSFYLTDSDKTLGLWLYQGISQREDSWAWIVFAGLLAVEALLLCFLTPIGFRRVRHYA